MIPRNYNGERALELDIDGWDDAVMSTIASHHPEKSGRANIDNMVEFLRGLPVLPYGTPRVITNLTLDTELALLELVEETFEPPTITPVLTPEDSSKTVETLRSWNISVAAWNIRHILEAEIQTALVAGIMAPANGQSEN